jgi:hypothetical protein
MGEAGSYGIQLGKGKYGEEFSQLRQGSRGLPNQDVQLTVELAVAKSRWRRKRVFALRFAKLQHSVFLRIYCQKLRVALHVRYHHGDMI